MAYAIMGLLYLQWLIIPNLPLKIRAPFLEGSFSRPSSSRIGLYSNIFPSINGTKSELKTKLQYVEIQIFNKSFFRHIEIVDTKIVILEPKWEKYRMFYRPIFDQNFTIYPTGQITRIKPRHEIKAYVRFKDLYSIYQQLSVDGKEKRDANIVFILYSNNFIATGEEIFFHNISHYQSSVYNGLNFLFLEEVFLNEYESGVDPLSLTLLMSRILLRRSMGDVLLLPSFLKDMEYRNPHLSQKLKDHYSYAENIWEYEPQSILSEESLKIPKETVEYLKTCEEKINFRSWIQQIGMRGDNKFESLKAENYESKNELLLLGDNAKYLLLLVQKIKSARGVIPFVGAGLSVDFGYKTWRDFLINISQDWGAHDHVLKLINESKFEEATDLLKRERTQNSLDNEIDHEYSPDKIKESDLNKRTAVKLLPLITKEVLITTNYDRVLESVFANEGYNFKNTIIGAKITALSEAIEGNERTLIKIHGDVKERSDRILSKEEYNNAYGRENNLFGKFLTYFNKRQLTRTPLVRSLFYLFNQNSILFIGCRLAIDRHLEILEEVTKTSGLLGNYAFLRYPGEQKAIKMTTDLSAYDISPIWYSGEKGDHSKLIDLLEYVLEEAGLLPRSISQEYEDKLLIPETKSEIIEKRSVMPPAIQPKLESESLTGRENLSRLLRRMGLESKLEYVINRQGTKFKSYKIVHLDLSKLSIRETELHTSMFNIFTSLAGLDLSANKFNSIPLDLFKGSCQGLSILNLSQNSFTKIDSIPKGLFRNLKNLRILILSKCSIENLPEGLFDNLSNLTEIDLSNNKLKRLPDLIFDVLKLSNLNKLELKNNLFESLSNNLFGKNSKVKILNFQGNKLTSLEEDTLFKELPLLSNLNLSGNLISQINQNIFHHSSNLKYLYLNHNKIKNLSSNLFSRLKNLLELHLEGNAHLTGIDPNLFHSLQHLTHLSLQGCRLAEFPESLFNKLVNLWDLNLAHNRLTSVPGRIFSSLTNLERLYLSYNEITSLNQDIFKKLQKLKTLSLVQNKIQALPDSIFINLSELEFLELSHNSIEKLPESIFDGLSSLTKLNISNNRIKELPDSIFKVKNLPNLIEINLAHNNNLEALPTSLVDLMDQLDHLDLTGTALYMKEFRRVYVSNNSIRKFKELYLKSLFQQKLSGGMDQGSQS